MMAIDRQNARRRVDHLGIHHVQRADKGCDKACFGRVINHGWRADLLDPPFIHHHDAIGHRQRFFLVVGHENCRNTQGALQRADFFSQRDTNFGVERGEWFIKQEHLRLDSQGAR